MLRMCVRRCRLDWAWLFSSLLLYSADIDGQRLLFSFFCHEMKSNIFGSVQLRQCTRNVPRIEDELASHVLKQDIV